MWDGLKQSVYKTMNQIFRFFYFCDAASEFVVLENIVNAFICFIQMDIQGGIIHTIHALLDARYMLKSSNFSA